MKNGNKWWLTPHTIPPLWVGAENQDFCWSLTSFFFRKQDGIVAGVLTSHHCGPGCIPGPASSHEVWFCCWFSVVLASRAFLWSSSFPLSTKATFKIPIWAGNRRQDQPASGMSTARLSLLCLLLLLLLLIILKLFW